MTLAILITEENLQEVRAWCGGYQTLLDIAKGRFTVVVGSGGYSKVVFAKPGMYIVRGPSGAYQLFSKRTIENIVDPEELEAVYLEAEANSKFREDFGRNSDYGPGDVIVVEYYYGGLGGLGTYVMALLKTEAGWFTTGQSDLRGNRKFKDFFEHFYRGEVEVHTVQTVQAPPGTGASRLVGGLLRTHLGWR